MVLWICAELKPSWAWGLSLISCYQFSNRMFNLHLIQFSHLILEEIFMCWQHWAIEIVFDSKIYEWTFQTLFWVVCTSVHVWNLPRQVCRIKGKENFENFFNCVQKLIVSLRWLFLWNKILSFLWRPYCNSSVNFNVIIAVKYLRV